MKDRVNINNNKHEQTEENYKCYTDYTHEMVVNDEFTQDKEIADIWIFIYGWN